MKHIRNFCIIAHIDHGKSTLADRLLDFTGAVNEREKQNQLLDSMDLERERGITIKSHAIQMEYTHKGQDYILNLIDTPGHVDFSYEVSRSIAACEGALLIVDAAQSIQAQTISNLYLALENDLEIIPVLNKVDLPSANPEEVTDDIVELLGCDASEVIPASAKTGIGIEAILTAIIETIPPPKGDPEAPLQALVFDSVYNSFRGVETYFKVVNGSIKKNQQVKFIATEKVYGADEVGTLNLTQTPKQEIKTGRLWMSYLDKDTDVMRYQGQAFNYVAFDELTQWQSPYGWNYMRSRLRSSSKELGLYMRATTNPGGPGHSWVKKMFIDPAPSNTPFWATDIETGETLTYPTGHSRAGEPLFKRRFIPASLFDNPHLAESGDYEAMLLSLPEHQKKQLLEGNWDVNEGAAFPEFNRNIHVVEPFDIPDSWTKFRACDYGYGSFTGVVWLAVTPSEQLIVYRELYCSKVTATDLADMILEAEARDGTIRYGVLDSSLWHNRGDTGPSLAEQMNMKGCRWRPSDRSKGSRISGKNELHRRLQVDEYTEEPRLVFFSTCTNTIAQLPSIPLDKRNPEDVDTNAEDHLYDALRYGIMTRPRSSLWDYNPAKDQRSGFQASDSTFGY